MVSPDPNGWRITPQSHHPDQATGGFCQPQSWYEHDTKGIFSDTPSEFKAYIENHTILQAET